MTVMEYVLGGMVLSTISMALGKAWGRRDTVQNSACKAKHEALEKLLNEKFEHVNRSLTRIEGSVNGKRVETPR